MPISCSIRMGVLAVALSVMGAFPVHPQNGPLATSEVLDLSVDWQARRGVQRYRLQLARDESFADIVFDKAVTGTKYVVKGLGKGRYFWRVAPAVGETGRFSDPQPVGEGSVVRKREVMSDTKEVPNALAIDGGGWRAVVGQRLQPVRVIALGTAGWSLIATNSRGTVFSFDGLTGEPKWSVNSGTNGPKGSTGSSVSFSVLGFTEDARSILVGGQGFLQLIDSSTGRQIWSRALLGTAMGAVAVNPRADRREVFFVTTVSPVRLTLIDSRTGDELSSTPLSAPIKGGLVSLSGLGEDSVLLGMSGGLIDVRDRSGKSLRSRQLDADLTSPAVVVKSGGSFLVAVATGNGLYALDARTLKLVWHIETAASEPAETLVSVGGQTADSRIAMLSRSGLLAVVNPITGKVLWRANLREELGIPAISDLNGDGYVDIVVMGVTQTVSVFSGRDGTALWTERGARTRSGSAAGSFDRNRVVTGPATREGQTLIILPDSVGPGLRAVRVTGPSQNMALR